MRASKSRSRSKGNRNRNTMGNVVNRVFDSSGPDGKVRGTPQQIIDKYNQLARDAQLANDRVATENFQQHAEHYLRMLSEAQREQEQRREQQERENRERQAQRDRERAEREGDETRGQDGERGDKGGKPESGGQDQGGGGKRRGKSGGGGQGGEQGPKAAEVVDFGGDGDGEDSHLVDTPENAEKPKPKRKPRKKPVETAQGDDTPAPAASDAASDG